MQTWMKTVILHCTWIATFVLEISRSVELSEYHTELYTHNHSSERECAEKKGMCL
jgi:hypothetical protein